MKAPAKSTDTENTDSLRCERCNDKFDNGKGGSISSRGSTLYFCERCFKSVFKFDPNMRTVDQLWTDNGRKTPFTVRSSNWHRSTYMVIREAKSTEGKGGKTKNVYVGDFYLRGELKEQNHVVGKANHFLWTAWSKEQAEKYREPDIGEGVAQAPEIQVPA